MTSKQIKLAREQLDSKLKAFESIKTVLPPAKGWIRAIRDVLGMSGQQLANRLNVNRQRISRIEQDEKPGKVTVETLRNVAKALDCEFVYAFVPRTSLKESVRQQAKKMAKKRMARSNQLMRLEKQELGNDEKAKALDSLAEEIMDSMPKNLWDE